MFKKRLLLTVLPHFRLKANPFFAKLAVLNRSSVPLRHYSSIRKEEPEIVELWEKISNPDFKISDPEADLSLFQKAIDHKDVIEGHPQRDYLLAQMHSRIGDLLYDQNDMAQALENYKASVDILVNLNQEKDKMAIKSLYYNMSHAYCVLKDWEATMRYTRLGFDLHNKSGLEVTSAEANVLKSLSLAYQGLQDMENSKGMIDIAIQIFREVEGKDSYNLIQCYCLSCEYYSQAEDWVLFFYDMDQALRIGTLHEATDELVQTALYPLTVVLNKLRDQGNPAMLSAADRMEIILEKVLPEKNPIVEYAYFELANTYTSYGGIREGGLQFLAKLEQTSPQGTKLDNYDYPRKAEALIRSEKYQEAQLYLNKLSAILDTLETSISSEELRIRRVYLDTLYGSLYMVTREYEKWLSYVENAISNSKNHMQFILIFEQGLAYYCIGKHKDSNQLLVEIIRAWGTLRKDDKGRAEVLAHRKIKILQNDESANKRLQKMFEDALGILYSSYDVNNELIPLMLQSLAQSYYLQGQYDKCSQTLESIILHFKNAKQEIENNKLSQSLVGNAVLDPKIPEVWATLLKKEKDPIEQKKLKIASLWMESSLKLEKYHPSTEHTITEGLLNCEQILKNKDSPEAKTLLGHARLYLGILYWIDKLAGESIKYLDSSIKTFEMCQGEQINLTMASEAMCQVHTSLYNLNQTHTYINKADEIFSEIEKNSIDPKDAQRLEWLSGYLNDPQRLKRKQILQEKINFDST